MIFYQTPEGRLGFRDIPPVLAEILRQVPTCSDLEDEAVEARLFPPPTEDPLEEGARDDWKAYVQPELHDLFQTSRQTVDADLRGLKEEGDFFTVEFSSKHVPAWLNALNQARLALAAQHNFDEGELSQPGPLQITNEKELALLQINFYAAVQQWLIETLEE